VQVFNGPNLPEITNLFVLPAINLITKSVRAFTRRGISNAGEVILIRPTQRADRVPAAKSGVFFWQRLWHGKG
jgi:hypothetical protein